MGVLIGFFMGALTTWLCNKMIQWGNEVDNKNDPAMPPKPPEAPKKGYENEVDKG